MQTYGRKVLHLVYLFVKDQSLAEDVTQDVFIKVYLNLERFRGESDIKTWIYRIAVNEAKKQLRSWVFRNIFASEKVHLLADTHSKVTSEKKLDHLDREEFTRYILQLPVSYRQMIALHYYQDLSIEEIAEILRISNGNVRNKLYLARKKLKRILEKEGYE